mmetsp:Transcript_75588/g.179622  ORF Transcript_75588/g.179622 Transcript_75588/m.179622 type:complete len:206 (-) Transcript_75588:56-673(-)
MLIVGLACEEGAHLGHRVLLFLPTLKRQLHAEEVPPSRQLQILVSSQVRVCLFGSRVFDERLVLQPNFLRTMPPIVICDFLSLLLMLHPLLTAPLDAVALTILWEVLILVARPCSSLPHHLGPSLRKGLMQSISLHPLAAQQIDRVRAKLNWQGLLHPGVIALAKGLPYEILLRIGILRGRMRHGAHGIARDAPCWPMRRGCSTR